eukprot:gene9228-biopygen10090
MSPGHCRFDRSDRGAHNVCIAELPHGFSSDTGQGPWSNEYAGRSWCICIWAYANYINTSSLLDGPRQDGRD